MDKKALKNTISDLDKLYQDVVALNKNELEEKYKYSGNALMAFLKRNKYKMKTFTEYKKDRDFLLFKELFDRGLRVSEISIKTGFKYDYIYNIFKKRGFDYIKRKISCNIDNINKQYLDEEFKTYKYDKRYAVSNYGRIYSFINNIFIKEYVEKNGRNKGYVRYNIAGRHQSKHRAVAEHFIDNPNNFKEVNHIDRNRQNNHFSNLEWCDRSYNVNHSINKENIKNKIRVARENGMKNAIKVFCIEDNKVFSSISECARHYGINYPEQIIRVCKGKNNFCRDSNSRKLTFMYFEKPSIREDINE